MRSSVVQNKSNICVSCTSAISAISQLQPAISSPPLPTRCSAGNPTRLFATPLKRCFPPPPRSFRSYLKLVGATSQKLSPSLRRTFLSRHRRPRSIVRQKNQKNFPACSVDLSYFQCRSPTFRGSASLMMPNGL